MNKFFIKHPTWNKWKNIMKKLIIAAVISFGLGFGVSKVDWMSVQDALCESMGVGYYQYEFTCWNCKWIGWNAIPKNILITEHDFECHRCGIYGSIGE